MSAGTYTVLARRFRPQGFADVVGQEHISQALRNAIRSNRVAHAYLFTGARGVGKTSTARILSKALNCPQSDAGNPCNNCEICDGISAGNDVDVLEIDGASNRGIDDIRQLRSNVNVSSMRTRHKIYIIDEVHALTPDAFNALLKTLEEPPPKVIFVFCTTEPNRIPDTILSRCQRFDFGTIETTDIKGRLRQIAQTEKVQVDDAALELVARRAAGSMRDSQSIFDQLLAFGEEHIQADDVHRLLGTAGDERLISIGAALVSRNQSMALDTFHTALDDGVQLGEFTDQLLFYLRDLMVLATGAERVELLSVGPASRETLLEQARTLGLQTIVASLEVLAETRSRMQFVTCGRALVELALVRIALLEDLTNVAGLIDRLRGGEVAVSSGQKKNDLKPDPPRREQTEKTLQPVQNPSDSDGVTADSAPDRGQEAEPVEEIRTNPDAVSPELAPSGRATVSGETGSAADVPAADVPAALAWIPENADAIWSQIVSEIHDMLKSHVKAVSQVHISAPGCLELTFPRRYHFAKRFIEQPDAVQRIEEVASLIAGQQIRIQLVLSEDPEDEETRMSGTDEPSPAEQSRDRVQTAGEDEFVATVMETFSAQCVRVDPVSRKSVGPDDNLEEESE